MVAYRCDAFIGQYTCYQPSGSSGRYFTFVGETNAGNNTNGIPVTFYIFGLPTLSDIPTFGMRVNDSTGSPTYHSRSEEHTSELQSLMRISYAVFCLKKKNTKLQDSPDNYIKMHKKTSTNT